MSLLLFFIGLWVGGIVGVFTMCLFQFSGKLAENEQRELYLDNREEGDLE